VAERLRRVIQPAVIAPSSSATVAGSGTCVIVTVATVEEVAGS
jgi:hypothetical protein